MLHGAPYYATGTYESVLVSANGCDSLTVLDLVVEPAQVHQVEVLCAGESIEFGGQMLTESGDYSFTETTVNNCSVNYSMNLTVLEELVGTGMVTPDDGQGTGSIMVTVEGGMAPYTFSWSNGMDTQNLDNLDAGTYTLVITDSHGCESSFTFVVDLQSQTWEVLGIESLELFPNPAPVESNLSLQIQSTENKLLQLSLYDVSGRALQNTPLTVEPGANTYILDAPQHAGLYFVQLRAGDGKTKNLRLVVH